MLSRAANLADQEKAKMPDASTGKMSRIATDETEQ